MIALYDCFCIPRRDRPLGGKPESIWAKRFPYSRARYLLPATIISTTSIAIAFIADDVRSTYICPHFPVLWRIMPFLQGFGTFLDCYVLICVDILIRRRSNNSSSIDLAAPLVISSVYLVSTYDPSSNGTRN